MCLDVNGDAVIVDWKRSANIKTQGFRGEMLHPPLDHMDDCNWSTYRLQINTYAYILESEYGLQVSAMYIAVFHPKQSGVPYVYIVRFEVRTTGWPCCLAGLGCHAEGAVLCCSGACSSRAA